jgi:two-component system, cell cycle sensor histidine kinase and response regulator CckA
MAEAQPSIKRAFRQKMLLIASFSIGILYFLWMHYEYRNFVEDTERARETFVVGQKEMIRREVTILAEQIQGRIDGAEKRARQTVQQRVDEAYDLVAAIHARGGGSTKEVGDTIREVLRSLRFNDGRGYYFIFNLQGVEELYADRPEWEGQNMLAVRGGRGEYVVKEMLDLVAREGAGFYEYTWNKPGTTGNSHRKIAYVRLFAPLGWVIGTGEYLADVHAEIQEELLDYLVGLQFAEDGYFFGSIYGGLPLFTNGRITRGGESIRDLTDPGGVRITEEYQRVIDTVGGGYVAYSWKKLHGEQPSPKISYVTGIPDWRWIIGAGVYLDTIEEEISQRRALLLRQYEQKALASLLLLCGIFLLIFFWATRIARRIEKSLSTFAEFSRQAATDDLRIDPRSLEYAEFVEIAGSINTVLDNRRAASAALAVSEQRYRVIFENTPLGLILFDQNGIIADCNQQLVALMGSSREKLIGFHAVERSAADMREALARALAGRPSFYENRYTSVTGGVTRDLRVHFNPLIPDQVPTAVIATMEDISERIRAEKTRRTLEEQLQQARKMEAIGTLAGGIAHDFNNILSAIMGYADMARSSCPDDSSLAGDLDQILKAAARARELVKQILAFSRQAESAPISVYPAVILKEAIRMIRPSLPSTIAIIQEIDDLAGPVLADPTQLHQVILNLCSNAAQAMEEKGGPLTLGLARETLSGNTSGEYRSLPPGDYVRLSVGDSGTGISAEVQTRMFDPFFTTKEVGRGTGLGLATVHGIVEACGGAIFCTSRLGQGALFTIFLPVTSEAAVEEEKYPGQIPTGQERVLFVDDEAILVEVGQAILTRLGYQVTTSTSAEKALALFNADPQAWDVVVTDQTMPEMTGLAMARRMLDIRPDLPVILCTGYSTQVSEEQALAAGIKEFAMKPLGLQDLATIVRRALNGGRTMPQ